MRKRLRVVIPRDRLFALRAARWRVLEETAGLSWIGAGLSAGLSVVAVSASVLWPQSESQADDGIWVAVSQDVAAPVSLDSVPVLNEPEMDIQTAGEPSLCTTDWQDPAVEPAVADVPSGTDDSFAQAPSISTAVSNPSADVSAESNYWQVVRSAVAGKLRYPSAARRAGVEGRVILRITVGRDGGLLSSVVTESSSDVLSRSAVDAVRSAAPFPPPPDLAARDQSAVIPIRFVQNEYGTRW